MQDYYFEFLFIQVFLVICISSSLAAISSNYKEGLSSVATLLMLELSKLSHYFLSYMLLQGPSMSTATIVQTRCLFQYYFELVWDRILREVWRRQCCGSVQWGTFFPMYTNLVVVRLIYSVVSSLILVLNVFTFITFLLVQRFNIVNFSAFNVNIRKQLYPKVLN